MRVLRACRTLAALTTPGAKRQTPNTGATVPGYERAKCTMMNVDGLRVPIAWKGALPAAAPKAGAQVRLRFYFRDATIYAFGN